VSRPFWLDRFPKSRRPSYPRFRGSPGGNDADVVIVGGGLTGCACAYSFAAAGVKVILLEAGRVGAGSTAGSPGLIREAFDASFQETAAAHGLRAARHLWQGIHRASLDFSAAIRRLDLRCDWAPQDLLHVARREPESVKRLRREYEARRQAGLDHSWVTAAALAREASLEGGAAIRTRGAVIDPYRAGVGLASAAVERGARFFEQTAVRRIRATRKRVEVATAGGSIRAQSVVIATATQLADLRGLRRHLHPLVGYTVVTEVLPAAVRRELGARTASLRDSADPPHFLRWLKDDRALFMGADQPPIPARARDKALVQRTGQLMYELSTLYPAISGAMPEWSWAVTHDGTADGLPFVGLHRNYPRHLFALGHGRHGAAVAWLAARLLLRQFQGEPDKGDELFGFSRILT
jgi:glycine/D-amino acid oxidase-like deaminating enzyme